MTTATIDTVAPFSWWQKIILNPIETATHRWNETPKADADGWFLLDNEQFLLSDCQRIELHQRFRDIFSEAISSGFTVSEILPEPEERLNCCDLVQIYKTPYSEFKLKSYLDSPWSFQVCLEYRTMFT